MDMSALGGSGISVQIKGNDLNKLRSIGKDIAQIVEDTKGTQNIRMEVKRQHQIFMLW